MKTPKIIEQEMKKESPFHLGSDEQIPREAINLASIETRESGTDARKAELKAKDNENDIHSKKSAGKRVNNPLQPGD